MKYFENTQRICKTNSIPQLNNRDKERKLFIKTIASISYFFKYQTVYII